MAVRKTFKKLMLAPAFVVVAASTAGAALAPKINQDPVVGAFLGGFVVLVVMNYF